MNRCRGWRLRLLFLVLNLLLAGFSSPPACAQAANSSEPVTLNKALDLLDRWQEQQHLYLKGNLGIGSPQLNELEAWLDQHATNWVVLLLESAADEQFRANDGRQLTGPDAVDEAIGKGLPNRTHFGQWRDPRTGEANGAFFILYLRERNFTYFGSDVFDRRGLGEDRWQGNLDRWAITAMRGGGRIVDAVKDTILNIHRQLDARIAAEIRAREQRAASEAAARAQAVGQAQAQLQRAADALKLMQERVAKLNPQSDPNKTGDLFHPDLASLNAELEAARSAFAAGQLNSVQAVAKKIQSQAERYFKQLDDFATARQSIELIAKRVEELAQQPFARAATASIESAR
ncbi:MAG: hypothetical protein AB1813_24475, partial [Verrucomicrobiota bacterium]